MPAHDFTDATIDEVRERLFTAIVVDPTALGATETFGLSQALQTLVRNTVPGVAAKLRHALRDFVAQWLPTWGEGSLREVAMALGRLRCTDAAAAIYWKIDSFAAHTTSARCEPKTADVLIGVLAGFAPAERLDDYLVRLFYDPRLLPTWSPLLLAGLARGPAETLPRTIERFVDLAPALESSRTKRYAVEALLEASSPELLARIWERLSLRARQWIVLQLGTRPGGRYWASVGRDTFIVSQRDGLALHTKLPGVAVLSDDGMRDLYAVRRSGLQSTLGSDQFVTDYFVELLQGSAEPLHGGSIDDEGEPS